MLNVRPEIVLTCVSLTFDVSQKMIREQKAEECPDIHRGFAFAQRQMP